ncbi:MULTISPECIES: transposase family protein [Pseudomonas]|jgi:putative transposase|uniref:transposase family protein n=1 Tax=Pseudomonas TaxID=286 RepID=UPI0021F91994|nr:transposase family protein [Pseudomonas putida]
MSKEIRTAVMIHTSKPVRTKVPPLKIPRPWKPANPTVTQSAAPYEALDVSDKELKLAWQRNAIFKQLREGLIGQAKAMELLGVKKSQFYNLYKSFLESNSYLDLTRKKRGTKPGSHKLTQGQFSALELSFQENYKGPSASSAKVWKGAQGLVPEDELPPSKYQCRKFVAAKPEKEKYYRKYGKEAGDNKYKPKPKKKIMERVLQQVQMDHTMVDMLLVDEFDRNVLVGRPWLTMIMCALTRVILGMYLSFRPPGLITVASALAFAVQDKSDFLGLYGIDPKEYPFYGIPFLIYTDNAAEFTSSRFIATCSRWGMDWDHRPVDKKWYGGLIERVVGTFMGEVHFLPGTTGSNVIQRAGLTPEKDAKYDIIQCGKHLLDQAILYHGTVHEGLQSTPRQAWFHYDSQGLLDHERVIRPDQKKRFELDFLAPSYNHTIQPYGINFEGRRYYSIELDPYIGARNVEIRFQPYDLDSIWVMVPGRFLHVPCTYTKSRLSNNWESYSSHKALSSARHVGHSAPGGLIDDEYALAAQKRQRELAVEVETQSNKKPRPPKDITAKTERLPTHPAVQPVIGPPRIIESSRDAPEILQPTLIIDRFKK